MLAGRFKRGDGRRSLLPDANAGRRHGPLGPESRGEDPRVLGPRPPMPTSWSFDHLKEGQAPSISLGLRDDFLIVALGSSTDAVARLGTSPLAARNEKRRGAKRSMAKSGSRPSSIRARRSTSTSARRRPISKNWRPWLKTCCPDCPCRASSRKGCGKTVGELASAISKSVITEIGGALPSVGFLTNRGTESALLRLE